MTAHGKTSLCLSERDIEQLLAVAAEHFPVPAKGRVALGPGHHSAGLLVADDLLFGLVPVERAAQDEGEVAENAQVGDADGGLDIVSGKSTGALIYYVPEPLRWMALTAGSPSI